MTRQRLCMLTAAIAAALSGTAHGADPAGDPLYASVTLPTLLIESTRMPAPVEQVNAPVAVRDRESMDRDQAANLADIMRMLPGVGIGGGTRAIAMEPVIRGLSGERVVIRVDNARQNFGAGHKGRIFLDPLLLEQVEVLRGPASTLYGSGALGGVVNFRTQDADSFLGPDVDADRYLSDPATWRGPGPDAGGFRHRQPHRQDLPPSPVIHERPGAQREDPGQLSLLTSRRPCHEPAEHPQRPRSTCTVVNCCA